MICKKWAANLHFSWQPAKNQPWGKKSLQIQAKSSDFILNPDCNRWSWTIFVQFCITAVIAVLCGLSHIGSERVNCVLYWPFRVVCVILHKRILDHRLNCNNSYVIIHFGNVFLISSLTSLALIYRNWVIYLFTVSSFSICGKVGRLLTIANCN